VTRSPTEIQINLQNISCFSGTLYSSFNKEIFFRGLDFSYIVSVLFFFICVSTASAEISIIKTSFQDGRYVDTTETLILRLNQFPEPEDGRLAIFIGKMDVTSQIRRAGKDLFYTPTIFPLTPGETRITLFLVTQIGDWQEIAAVPLKVLTESGFETAEFNPSLDINFVTQLVEEHSSDADEPIRKDPYVGLDFQGGFSSLFKRSDFELTSQINIIGTSFQERALRFGELGTSANHVEMSDYLVNLKKGGLSLGVGNISHGNHRYLLNGFSSRGVYLNYNFNNKIYLSAASMNATSIVGWDNFSGLEDFSHNITGQTIGANLLNNEKGKVNIEFSHMQGSKVPVGNFNEGQVVDAEKSDGFGLRLNSQNVFGRFNADIGAAQSTFNNQDDTDLLEGLDAIETKETTDYAYYGDFSLDLIQNWEMFEDQFFTLNTNTFYEKVDPLYRSVGGFTTPNMKTLSYGATATLGGLIMEYQHTRSRNNLDEIASFQTQKTFQHVVSASVPLPEVLSGLGSASIWFPVISYNYSNTHQFAELGSNVDFGGISDTFLPDQITISHNGSAVWTWSEWSLEYRFAQTLQDNRHAFFRTPFTNPALGEKFISNHVDLSGQVLDNLFITAGGGLRSTRDFNTEIVQETYDMEFSFDWNILPSWFLSGNTSILWEMDSKNRSSTRSHTFNTMLAKEITVNAPWGASIPGRIFLGLAKQKTFTRENFVDADSLTPGAVIVNGEFITIEEINNWDWRLNAGISINLF
jgi:hypothetical protein